MLLRFVIALLGAACLVIAGFLAPQWYDQLPRRSDLPPPEFRGDMLLRAWLALQGLLLLAVAVRPPAFTTIAPEAKFVLPEAPEPESDLSPATAHLVLAAVALIAFALRLYGINSDLWLDEINPVVAYRHVPALEIFVTYLQAGNHMLNTFLVKVLVTVLGEKEWVIRIPALLFGTALVPALYWLSRFAFTRWQSLAVALLSATSYHLVFFSQNSRGYAGYLFFSVLATGLLLKALKEDRPAAWAGYIAVCVLDMAIHMIAGFVVAGHFALVAAGVMVIWRSGKPIAPLCRRVFSVYTIVGLLAVGMYITVLPEFLIYQKHFYQEDKTAGFSPFSMEFLLELARGITAGFSPGMLAGLAPFLLIAAWGFVHLTRRHWALAMGLASPLIVMGAYMVVRAIPISPRFFLLAVPLALMTMVEVIWRVAAMIEERIAALRGRAHLLTALAVGLVATVFLASLAGLYRYPKQDYSGAIRFLDEQREPGAPVIVIHFAEQGMRYYGVKTGWREDTDFICTRSPVEFNGLAARNNGKRLFAVTSFTRALRIEEPEIRQRLENDWTLLRKFPSTIGDGAILVWERNRVGEAHTSP